VVDHALEPLSGEVGHICDAFGAGEVALDLHRNGGRQAFDKQSVWSRGLNLFGDRPCVRRNEWIEKWQERR
ncbi:hypothetical protein, partial [Acinetobacter baumannii]|uniref:hypothetical protein n=1 Tax=Acinetobacter baumannii TaxID=470 RepID=UPI0037C72B2B